MTTSTEARTVQRHYTGPVTALLVTAEGGRTGIAADPENVYSMVVALPPNPDAAQLHLALAEVFGWAGDASLMTIKLVNAAGVDHRALTAAAASVGRNRRASLIVV